VDFGERLARYGPLGWRRYGIGVGEKLRESFAVSKFGITKGPSGGRICDSGVGCLEFATGDAPLLRRDFDEKVAGGFGDAAQLRNHGWSGAASERAHVEGSEFGVAHDHADGGKRDAEFVGNRLRERGAGVLADFDFAGERGNSAVFADVQPRS